MIRCPNFRDETARKDFNAVLARLGGVAMSADDIAPRQPYLSRLNEKQTDAYHVAHYLWNEHKTPGEIVKFLDALDAVNAALAGSHADKPGPAKKTENKPESPAAAGRAEVIETIPGDGLEALIIQNNDQAMTYNVMFRDPGSGQMLPTGFVRIGSLVAARAKARETLAGKRGKGDVEVPAAAPEAAPLSNLPAINLARDLLERLRSGKPITAKIMQQMASEIYGAKLAEGHFDRKDMQDALELAVNMHIANTDALMIESDDWRAPIAKLDELLSKLPTQRVRSEEQESFQQFSTPPNYAAAAVWAAKLGQGDVFLEPSAGTGSLVAPAFQPGVKIVANELSERRRALLRVLVGRNNKVFGENAEQINNTLPDDVRPTVVVMNPPFSQTAGRMGDRKVPMTGAIHVEQALKKLEPGGRLVAIVGRGMTMGQPAYRAWWKKIGEDYKVVANIGVDGKVYEKYGTTFGTRLLVIDKVKPDGTPPVTADAQTVEDLMRTLEPIRDARPQSAAEQHGAEPRGAALAEGSQGAGAERVPSPVEPGAVGPGDASGGGVAEPARAPGASERPVRVEGGERAPLDVQQSGGREPAGAAGQPAPAAGDSGRREGGVEARPGNDTRPASEPEQRAPASSERVELEHAEPGSQGTAEISESLYDQYRPQRVKVAGAKQHPSKLVESSAMASVAPPTPKYQPSLPKAVIEKGLLSDAQLEAVVYAGEAHQKMLPATEGTKPQRKGYFIGDGTGVGKGREVAGIILDNFQQGRTKAIWVSEKQTLIQDAQRDWSGLQQKPDLVFNVSKVANGEPIKGAKGIAFITYDTLKGGMSDQAALTRAGFVRKQKVMVNGQAGTVTQVGKAGRGQPQITVALDNGTKVTVGSSEVKALDKATVKSRVDQLVEWFGEDFDGVVAFDEAHNMGNAVAEKGDRGKKDAAMKALAGLDLQRRLPNARVVYVSATGATEVSNLAYAERLGLWGRGTPFASRAAFTSEVAQGGIAAMELIARDMKQLGLYTARNLSYDGVNYERIEHKLTPDQREIYDTLAEAWQVVLRNINKALELTGGEDNGPARNAAMSAFWGGHQRFFNQVVTSLQMPSVLKAVERDLEEKRQVVLQLTNTNEASQERAAAKAKTAEDIEDLDITPRDQIIQLVEHSFPTQEYEQYVDDDGKVRSRPVMDSAGNPVQNKEAVAMRDALIERLASVRVPQGPLDMVLDHFGIDTVAEVTGRKRRFVLKPDEKTGQRRRVEDSRPGSANIAETDAFQSGKKKVLIFSEAGGTGRSYHADNTAPSKNARRAHYLVQGGWRADKAVQGFGRTHRSNQASAPIFNLVTTDLQGQKRFISSIARRLGQLGALTKGQRQAGDQGIFSARDNLESTEAQQALRQFFRDLQNDAVPGININDFEEQTGLELRQKDEEGGIVGNREELPPITQFLNRLLSLKIDLQNEVFQAFSDRLDHIIEARREAGLLDVGLETIRADKIEKAHEQTVHKVEGTDADTKYVKLRLSNKYHPTEFDTVADNPRRPIEEWLESPNGKVYAAAKAPSMTDENGRIVDNYRLISPVSDARTIPQANITKSDTKWKKISKNEASALWRKEIAGAPEYVTRDMHLITGAILPIWDRLKGNPRVVRLQTDKGERLIGRVVPNDAIGGTLKALGAEVQAQKFTPLELFQKLSAGARVTLANGWRLSRRLVAGEHRIELTGPNSFSEARDVKADGVFTERIEYKTRYFVPMEGAEAERVLKKLTEYRPVIDLSEPGSSPTQDLAAGDEMFSIRGAAGDNREGRVTAETDQLGEAVGRRIMPALRAELDKMGLHDVALNLPGKLTARAGGKTYLLNGHYINQVITVALDAPHIRETMHHEALHALRDMGLFTDAEWNILSNQSRRAWRKQHEIEKFYGHLNDAGKDEEGIAHAYAEWATGKPANDGRIVRLFKRIKAFLEALRNAVRGLGFKTAEDVFRDVREGEIGSRERTGDDGEQSMFAMAKRNPKEFLTVKGRPAWAVVVDNADHAVLHTVRYRAAVDGDFHHNFYLPREMVEKVNDGEARVVWGDERGLHSMEPMPDKMRGALEQYYSQGEAPMFSVREEAPPAEAVVNPALNLRIRNAIERVFTSERATKIAQGYMEHVEDLSTPVKLLQRELEQRRAGTFEDPEDFYTRKRLYVGRVAAWSDTFNREHLDPLVNLLKSNGVSRAEADDYLYALHAAERNAEMDKINPALGGEGSGMSDDEAEKILAEAKRGEHADALEELRERVGSIRSLILTIMERSGLEKPDVIAAWNEKYKDYVPLRGWEVEPDNLPPEYRGPGAGFNVRGKEVKQAFGRRSKADSPLVNLFDQAYRTFDRAERNRYLQSLYRAIDDLGDDAEDIAKLDRGERKRKIDPTTGLVRSYEGSPLYNDPRAVYLKFDGNPHFLLFKDQNLAEAVKRMSPDSLGALQPALVLQNKLKAMWTHYSPEFLLRHFMFRYPFEGAVNALEFKNTGDFKLGKYLKEAHPLLGKGARAIFAWRKGVEHDDPEVAELQKYWNEMRRAGGAMMFRNMRDMDLTREHLETMLKDLSDNRIQNMRAKWRKAVEVMDTITNTLDNAQRLATYAAARRQGATVQQAAFKAREATQDFQLKGRKANAIGIPFPFGNVAVQTGARYRRGLARSRWLRRAAAGLFAAGFATAAWNYLVGGNDKDGRPFFDKVPPWERGTEFVVFVPGAKDAKGRPQPVKIPLMWGVRLPFMIGTTIASGIFGKEKKTDLALLVLHELLSTFTFLGEVHNIATLFVPETAKPAVEVATNKSWTGSPVHSDETFQKHPNAYTAFRSTGPGWRAVAQALNTATGGSPGKSGLIDLYPEDIRTLLDPFIGTQLRFGENVAATGAAAIKGEWPDPGQIPFGRVIFGTDYDAADRARGRELRDRLKHPWKN